jgi:hypothetical protein
MTVMVSPASGVLIRQPSGILKFPDDGLGWGLQLLTSATSHGRVASGFGALILGARAS